MQAAATETRALARHATGFLNSDTTKRAWREEHLKSEEMRSGSPGAVAVTEQEPTAEASWTSNSMGTMCSCARSLERE
jgi:hypothetical protein